MTEIGVGIIGFGTVGAGVAEGLLRNRTIIRERTGIDVLLRRIADIDITTDRGIKVDNSILTTDAASVIAAPDIQIIVELIGGTGIAKKFICDALNAGKSVVTANKKLLAEYGEEIFNLAEKNSADVFFGASVGGGIPIIRSLRDGLAGNNVESIYAILNGTCNYILTRMEKEGLSFDTVLKSAQELGFAEADPALDVDGFDTLHKAAILSSLAFGFFPDVHSLHVEGIRNAVEGADIKFAVELGYRIKLLAIIKNTDGRTEIRVTPALVPLDNMLASVSDVFNAAMIKGDLTGKTLYYGRGAGRFPTASTVIGDIIDIAKNIAANTSRKTIISKTSAQVVIKPFDDIIARHYVRLFVADKPGSLAAVSSIFSKHGVSISAALQKDIPDETGDTESATIIILTHSAKQSNINSALAEIEQHECCCEKPRRLEIID